MLPLCLERKSKSFCTFPLTLTKSPISVTEHKPLNEYLNAWMSLSMRGWKGALALFLRLSFSRLHSWIELYLKHSPPQLLLGLSFSPSNSPQLLGTRPVSPVAVELSITIV